jgi:glucose/arabinose dehydrogenase
MSLNLGGIRGRGSGSGGPAGTAWHAPLMPRSRPLLAPIAAVAALALGAAGCGSTGVAAGQGDRVRLVKVGDFSAPLHVTAPPGDRRRAFVVEQAGRIWVVRGGKRLPEPFLDISGRISAGGERGLLSLAFAPDYGRSGRFYVYFTGPDGAINVVEYRRGASPDAADPASARSVLVQPHPASNHNGGLLLFGPDDLLYIGVGDGGGGGDQHGRRGNGQDLGALLGKILRIDPRPAGGRPYQVPRSNPFVRRAGARGEIYAYGLRNPWRFSFDRRTGDLAIGDVGESEVEEVDFARRGRARGANYGWRVFEGDQRFTPGESAPGAVRPVITRRHSDGWCSLTGGVVVRDPEVPALAGRYLFGDICKSGVWSARLRPGRAQGVRETGLDVQSVSSFGEDARGRVYVTSIEGPVYRLAAG